MELLRVLLLFPLRFRVPLRGSVLRRSPIQRQARLQFQLPGDGGAGDTTQQSRRRRRKDPENMNPATQCHALRFKKKKVNGHYVTEKNKYLQRVLKLV